MNGLEIQDAFYQIILDRQTTTVRQLAMEFDLPYQKAYSLLKKMVEYKLIHINHGRITLAENLELVSLVNGSQVNRTIEFLQEMIREQSTIFLDASMDGFPMVNSLFSKKFTIVTNSVHIAKKLVNFTNLKVIVVNGFIDKQRGIINGRYAQDSLRKYRFDVCLIHPKDYDQTRGFRSTCESDLLIQKQAIALSKLTGFVWFNYVKDDKLCDSFLGYPSSKDQVFLLNDFDDELVEKFKKNNMTVIY